MAKIEIDFVAGNLPECRKGGMLMCVALVRGPDSKARVIPAYYLNAHPLEYQDTCEERGCPKDENHDDGCPTTGWFYDESNFEYDNCYHQISGDVLGWAMLPKGDSVEAALSLQPASQLLTAAKHIEQLQAALSAVSIPRGEVDDEIQRKTALELLQPYLDDINGTPELLSLLYDINLMPEQVRTVKDAIHLAAITDVWKRTNVPSLPPAGGWRLVPVEPTQTMITAYCEAQEKLGIHAWANASVIWPAMLAAAPAPPASDKE